MKKPLFFGGLGFFSLILLYLLVMLLLSRSLKETVLQFSNLWPWIVSLSAGFGLQVGLYAKIRELINNSTPSKSVVMTTGATSSVSMVVCCAHHLTDVLPFLGFSAASLFLVRYQTPILTASLFVNALGIVIMIRNLKEVIRNEA